MDENRVFICEGDRAWMKIENEFITKHISKRMDLNMWI